MVKLSLAETIISGGSIYRGLEHEQIKSNCVGLKGNVLDVGAGSTPYYTLFDKTAHVYRADIDPKSGADYIFDANKQFPLKSGTFDNVFCMNVLEHLYNPKEAISECNRVLKEGGKLFLGAPFLFPYHTSSVSSDFFRYSHEAAGKMLTDAGFSKVKVIRLGGRFSSVLELIAQNAPRPMQGIIRLPYILLRFLDKVILSEEERRTGSRVYLGIFAVAEK